MAYELEAAIASLSATGNAIRSLVEDVSQRDAVWKPAVDRWSIIEVVNHLADEEKEDFRARLDVILHDPDADFAPIDPPGAVVARRYADRDINESVERYLGERTRSIAWLRSLKSPDFERVKRHPVMGEMSGRLMLVNWVAHDLHHVRQLANLRHDLLAAQVEPISLAYAGDW